MFTNNITVFRMENPKCKLYEDCVGCTSLSRDVFYQLRLIKGYVFQQYRHKRNEVLFIIEGEVCIKRLGYPDMFISKGQVLSLPVGFEMDITILEDVNCLVYVWGENDFICEKQYRVFVGEIPNDLVWSGLDIVFPLHNFLDSIILNLENGVVCDLFWSIKEQELMLLFKRYYSEQELINFMAPTLHSFNRFRIFVQHNYYRVKTVEELAMLGGYGIATFRRLFKNEYGESAHNWIIKQKQENILYDLQHRDISISDISYKYQFESLPQFSNFCKKYFGRSPREIVKSKTDVNTKKIASVQKSEHFD